MTDDQNEIDVYERQGYGNSSGFGERPAVLVVDFVNGFADPDQFGGGNIGDAIENTAKLLAAARTATVPIAYTRVVYADDGSDVGVFCLKAPNLAHLKEDADGSQIVAALAPEPGDYIVRKTQPSAFFGTNLSAWLINKGVDTVVVTGCTTSGCVRASVVDSMSYNFKTIVVTDCVGDRAMGPHRANLFDMHEKYADLMTGEEVAARLADCETARPV
ncbi:MAG: isochorismatase family protein [Pseudomonadota bacterium]